MSLENELKKNTEALIANTNALAANEKGTKPASSPAPAQASPAASAPVPVPEKPAVSPAIPADVLDVVAPATAAIVLEAPVTMVGEVIDKKQVIAAFINLGETKGRAVAVQFLATRGVSKASELNDVAAYPEILAAIIAATEAQ